MSDHSHQAIYTRQSLLERLRNWDDSVSWRDFFDTYWKLIYGVARKAGLDDTEAQDVVQETIIAVAKKMPEFRYDRKLGTFKAWLMQLTRWRITDHFRKRGYQKQGECNPREIAAGDEVIQQQAGVASDLDSLWEREWQEQLLEAALDNIRAHANPTQFQMFYLHVSKNLPARDVAKRLNVKLAEVYFAKYKIAAAIKKEIKRIEQRML